MKPNTIAVRFLHQFLQDREQGRERTLAEYQQMFSADPEAVAREFEAVTAPDPEAGRDCEQAGEDGRYAATETIGRGGMGTVERVFDAKLERSVARKVLGDGGAALPEVAVLRRFEHEARVMARLQHPGIVPVHDLGFDERGRPYFTMPLIEGQDLAQVVRQLHDGDGAWTLVRCVELVARVAEAVAHAHDRGVVHRDLKPANVMVGEHGEAYVVDWGVARVMDREPGPSIAVDPGPAIDPGLTRDGDVVGTPAYMSPEQARGDRAAVDRRSDVYALGSMLYHVLTGSPPYASRGSAASGRKTREAVLAGPPEPVASLDRRVAPELVSICERAMARAPSDRYQAAGELARDLRAFLENRVVQAHAVGPFAELRTWVRRNRLAATTSTLAVVALLVGLVVSLQLKLVADRNAAAADSQAAAAEQNFELAFEAAESLLVEFGLYTLDDDPAVDPMRQALAERALTYYRRFCQLRGDDARLADKVALSHFRIASLASQLGQVEAAEAALERAKAEYERMSATGGEHRFAMVQIAAERGLLWMNRGELEAAIGELEWASRELVSLLGKGEPGEAELLVQASLLHNLALACGRNGDHERAQQLLQQKLDVTGELLRRWPELAKAADAHASGLELLARQHERRREFPAAANRLGEAVAALERGLQQHPQDRGLRRRLCEVLNLRASNARQRGAIEDAIAAALRAVEVGRQLVAANPDVRDFQGNLAGALCNAAMMQQGREDPEVILALLCDARAHVQHALRLDARHAAFRSYRRIIGRELARACLVLNRAEQAAAHVRELVAEQPEQHDWLAAVMLASCATLSAQDAALEPAEQQRRVQAYGDEAMKFLRAAVQRGTYMPDRITDISFQALRTRDDFRSLVERAGR